MKTDTDPQMEAINRLLDDNYWEDKDAEEIAFGIALHDISALLPKHQTKVFPPRKNKLTTLFIHHAGADNGMNGIRAVIPAAKWHIYHHDWAGIGYQFAITIMPTIDSLERLVIFRVGSSETVRAHTRLCNRFSDGVWLQGHHGRVPLSPFQVECLEALIPWWMIKHGRNYKRDLCWHSASWKHGGIPKKACPGKFAVQWLKNYIS